MMTHKILAHKLAVGSVTRCPHGCYHLRFGRVNLTMTESEYIELVALINDSVVGYEQLRCPDEIRTGLDEGYPERTERDSEWET